MALAVVKVVGKKAADSKSPKSSSPSPDDAETKSAVAKSSPKLELASVEKSERIVGVKSSNGSVFNVVAGESLENGPQSASYRCNR